MYPFQISQIPRMDLEGRCVSHKNQDNQSINPEGPKEQQITRRGMSTCAICQTWPETGWPLEPWIKPHYDNQGDLVNALAVRYLGTH